MDITLSKLTKRYGSSLAVDDVSATIPAGRVTGLLGPNGAGKTTIFRMLTGLTAPTSGSATIGGSEYRHIANPMTVVGTTMEVSGFCLGATARRHLELVASTGGIRHPPVDALLEQVGLDGSTGRRKVKTFSLGMRQRLRLAAALLGDPAALLLDEPTNGLDAGGIAWLRHLLRIYAREGRTVLVASHLLAEVAQAVDDVLVLNRGRVLYHGAVADLVVGMSPTVRLVTDDPHQVARLVASGGAACRVDGGEVRCTGGDLAEIDRFVRDHHLPVSDIALVDDRLEHAYTSLIGADGEGRVVGLSEVAYRWFR